MDDNENLIDFQKMNFSPFSTQFTGIPANSTLHQFTTAKFAQNLTTSNGQVVSLVSGADGNVQFLRSIDGTTTFQNQTQQSTTTTNISQAQTFILPITMPGDKPGDAQQTVQIQVLNPNHIQQAPKFQNFPMQLPMQGFQQPTVLTVAVPQDSEMLPNHGLPEGVTVLAAIQPQDLQLFAQPTQNMHANAMNNGNGIMTKMDQDNKDMIAIKQEPVWHQNQISAPTNDIADYLARQGISLNLQQFLKFDPEHLPIKREVDESSMITGDAIQAVSIQQQQPQLINGLQQQQQQQQHQQQQSSDSTTTTTTPTEVDANGKPKKKRKYKKKPPKPKPPKPGQVHIATAADGTVLFCCPECQLAFSDKTNLEQHLSVHKIERRYICDICGAGLKRKEHLERHKLGHSPERPHICGVCKKGFKRKEHLNLHFVIHSGDKNEICGECGKGFYRKDHLRKHAKSHATKRLKEELAAANGGSPPLKKAQIKSDANVPIVTSAAPVVTSMSNVVTSTDSLLQQLQQQQQHMQQLQPGESQTICLPGVTIHVPTSDNTTLPVQIQLPQLVTTSAPDGSTSTVVLQPPTPMTSLNNNNNNVSMNNISINSITNQPLLP